MGRLLRLAAYVALATLIFRIAYPDGESSLYFMLSLPAMLGGALAVLILIKIIDISSRAGIWFLEGAFLAAVVLYLGLTFPQRKGAPPPLKQILDGEIPTQAAVARGIARLGADPEAAPARFVVGLFPKANRRD